MRLQNRDFPVSAQGELWIKPHIHQMKTINLRTSLVSIGGRQAITEMNAVKFGNEM